MKEIKSNYYIVLRDNFNTLIDWRGYAELSDAKKMFYEMYGRMNSITDGEFELVEGERIYFANDKGYRVELMGINSKLLLEIIFDEHRFISNLFNDIVSGLV